MKHEIGLSLPLEVEEINREIVRITCRGVDLTELLDNDNLAEIIYNRVDDYYDYLRAFEEE